MHSFMKKLCEDEKRSFKMMLMELSDYDGTISLDEWREMVKIMLKLLELFDTKPNEDVKNFVKWSKMQEKFDEKSDEHNRVLPNHYVYMDKQTGQSVDMEFGSIHSVKGRTHLATLILETYMKSHNMKSILKYLCGNPPKTKKHPEKKLKCQYVAMTRARALVCLAIPVDFVDEDTQEKLKQIGWNLKLV